MKMVKFSLGVVLAGMLLATFGCVKNNIPGPEAPLPENEYFNFATRGTVKLNINYNTPDYQAHVEIYDENPVEVVNGAYLKKNIRPVYSAFTDKNGKLVADMYIPTAVSEAYLYSSTWGFPVSVKLNATANGFEYDSVKDRPVEPARSTTKAAMNNFTGPIPYKFGTFSSAFTPGLELFSICKWDVSGSATQASTGDNYISVAKNAGKINEPLETIKTRVQAHFDATSNKKEVFLADEEEVNIRVLTANTELDVTFIAERAAYANSVGYYYYKAGSAPQTRDALWKLPKYILFPDVTNDHTGPKLPTGATARLQFFGENYQQEATTQFPAGYVVGWFFISDGFGNGGVSENANMLTPLPLIMDGQNTIFYSNDKANDAGKDNRRFVMLNDTKSGLTVLGFEDQVVVNEAAEDYSDVLFFVTASQEIENPGPEIPDPDPIPEIKTEILSGTVAFEDIWPYGGDYDLNDVAVGYERVIRYTTDNNIVDITESFKYKHAAGSAVFNNFFAVQVANEGVTRVTPSGVAFEGETKSFVITKSAKDSGHPAYSVIRTFAAGTHKDVIIRDFNPYIIVGDKDATSYPKTDRVEVHLPKHLATSLAKKIAGEGDDAYYVKKDGSYPFAIDITESGESFKLAKEMENIGVAYPKFNSWANSKGESDKDWYKYPKQ